MPDSQPTARAIELAEQILDAVTRPRQDWQAVHALAAALAGLAAHQPWEPHRREDPARGDPAPETPEPS